MRKIWIVTMSAIIGSMVTVAIILALTPKMNKSFKIEHISGAPARTAFFIKDEKGNIVPLDFVGISKKVMDAVVNIQSTQPRRFSQGGQSPFDDEFFRYFFGPDAPEGRQRQMEPQVGIGSGVIINEEGYIVTNNHVVSGASELTVTLHDNRSYKGEVVGTDPSTDLALVRIKEKGLPVIPIANSEQAQVGEWVLAVGNPYGLTSTVTVGIISAKARSLNIISDKNAIESFIQTDAAINPGNSGGALVNLQGGLIGINTAIASPTGSYSGYGFAISSNIVNKVVEDLIKYGEVRRGFLGVMLHNITGKFAEENNLKINQGAYIDSVVSDGAAAKAGIRKGDVVVEVDGIEIRQSSELQEIIAEHHPGDKVNITVNRNGEVLKLIAILKSGEGSTKVAENNNKKTSLESLLGADLTTIDKNLAEKLKIEGGVQITNLRPGKLSSQTQIKNGFIVTKVNDQRVKTAEELQNILNKRKGGGVMFEGIYEDITGTFFYAFGL